MWKEKYLQGSIVDFHNGAIIFIMNIDDLNNLIWFEALPMEDEVIPESKKYKN